MKIDLDVFGIAMAIAICWVSTTWYNDKKNEREFELALIQCEVATQGETDE